MDNKQKIENASELFLETMKGLCLGELKNDFRKALKDILKSNDETVFSNKIVLNICREAIDDLDVY